MTLVEVVLVLALASFLVGVPLLAVRALRRQPPAPMSAGGTDRLSPLPIIVSLLIPILGVVIAIVLLAQGRGSHGAAALLASALGWLVAAVVLL